MRSHFYESESGCVQETFLVPVFVKFECFLVINKPSVIRSFS